MRPFELQYVTLEPFLLPLHRLVRQRLLKFARDLGGRPAILDVGGRKSHYTIGIPADITLMDLPRETEVQEGLGLGINQAIVQQIYARRSNVRSVLVDDMARTRLPDASFDLVIAVEVLEHVEDDALFVRQVHRVLKPGGIFFMTTPNGDFVKNASNPDHRRHYTRSQLRDRLAECFGPVEVEYAVADGRFRNWGLNSWSPRHPFQTLASMVGNFVNWRQSARAGTKERAIGTHNLVATARKVG